MIRPVETAVALALAKIRTGVFTCCWIIGLGLIAQMIIWSLITFTEMRFQLVAATASANSVVIQPETEPKLQLFSTNAADFAAHRAADGPPPDPNRIFSAADRVFRAITILSGAAITLAVVGLFTLLALGVVVAAGGSVPGVEKTVSAFGWMLVLAMMILHLDPLVRAAGFDGALINYDVLATEVEAGRAASPTALFIGGPVFYARYFALPLAAVIGAALVGLRFNSGVEAARLPKESRKLDPRLEKEAANMSATSLYAAGRSSGALTRVVGGESTPTASAVALLDDDRSGLPSATKVSAGQVPRRLI